MSLARAFTTRRVRQTLELKDGKDAAGNAVNNTPSDGLLHRKQSTKAFTTHGSIRNKISAPVELTHTTNMLSYHAPDIFPHRVNTITANVQSSPSTSSKSDDESDSGFTAASTPPTSPDTPFPDDKRAMSPEPNHLSCYFMPPRQMTPEVNGLGIASADATSSPNASPSPAQAGTAAFPASEAPAIPQRAPSHTKKSYDGLVRNRSVSRMSEQSVRSLSTKASFSFSRSSSSSTSTSVTSSTSHTSTVKPSTYNHAPSASVGATPSTIMSGPPPVSHKKDYSETHPFGHELAKVSELVEEFGKEETVVEEPAPIFSSNPIFAEEERELISQGLKKYSAESYISDIQGLMSKFFAESSRPVAAVWI